MILTIMLFLAIFIIYFFFILMFTLSPIFPTKTRDDEFFEPDTSQLIRANYNKLIQRQIQRQRQCV